MKKVLVISGHNNLNESFANKMILSDLEKALPEAQFDYLDALYGDYKINVPAEQEKLVNADIIVFQFPIFWYSMPSLLTRWFEDVFVHGFSHGSTGKALQGKKMILSFTTGSPAFTYAPGEIQNYRVEDLIEPRFKQLASLTGMEYEGFIYTGGLSYNNRTDDEKVKVMTEAAHAHAKQVVEKVKQFM